MAILIRRQDTTSAADPREKRRIAGRLKKILSALRLEDSTLSVLITSREKMRDLNKIWRDKTYYPRVLSFPQVDPGGKGSARIPRLLGDIAVSEKPGVSDRLLVHSVLHLLGHEHDTDEGYADMRRRENEILAAIKKL